MKTVLPEITDAMVKAAAMAVVQDWENGSPLTAEACWDNTPAKLREKHLRQSRAALEAAQKEAGPLLAAYAVPALPDEATTGALQVLYDGAMRWVMAYAMSESDADKIVWASEAVNLGDEPLEALRELLQRILSKSK